MAADSRPHVVIIGGGFAGIYAARALRKAPVRITLVDKRNHHLFQPLLYQVATAGLSPGDIAEPIRNILRGQVNATVRLDEALSVDLAARRVTLAHGHLDYDTLLLCAGVTHTYFGNDQWADLAPGLKSLEDAVTIRRRFLMSFEEAEREDDPAVRRRKLTFVIVGAGPTGVELAGTMAEMARRSLPRDFRVFKPEETRVVLLEGGDRVLSAFDPSLSQAAREQLEARGVEVRTGAFVTQIEAQRVMVGDEVIEAENVFWAAGVKANPIADTLGVEQDRAGRIVVGQDLTVPGHPEVFVLGDMAHMIDASGAQVPGVAQGAIQTGQHAAETIRARVSGQPMPLPFVYNDKGMLATIGRSAAVAQVGGAKFRGFVAWVLWLFIHLLFLIGFDNQLLVLIQWCWSYVNFKQGARLITSDYASHADPRRAGEAGA